MTPESITYSWRSNSKKTALMSAACLVAGIWIAGIAVVRPQQLSTVRTAVAAVVAALFVAASLGLCVDQLITIDRQAGCVSRTMTFFGLVLWTSQWPLSLFSGVNTYRLKGGTPQSPMDLVHVGLMRTNGSTLAVKYFPTGRDQPCPAAEAFAADLWQAFDRSPRHPPDHDDQRGRDRVFKGG